MAENFEIFDRLDGDWMVAPEDYAPFPQYPLPP